MKNPTQVSRVTAALLLLLIVALGAAACGADADDSASTSSDSAMAFDTESPAMESRGEAEPQLAPGDLDDAVAFDEVEAESDRTASITTGAAAGQPVSQLPDIGRDIIFTADIELGSTDVSRATREAIRAIEGRGGFVFSQETYGGVGGSSVIVFKVLPEQFQAALNDLGSIGSVRSQSISAEDVSAIVVDLESRITTAEASVRRLRNLLDEANDFEIIASLENQLLQRETTLEQYRGQLRSVQGQVDLATITVRVTELLNRPAMTVQASTFAGHDDGFGCFEPTRVGSTEPGEPTTVCYWVTNAGDTALIDLTLVDPALGASIGDLVVVEGTPAQLDPGEAVLFAHEFELEETVRVRSAFTATALNPDGDPLAEEIKATAATFTLEVIESDDGIPSFGDAWSGSLNALATIAIVIALVAVAVAPFALVALVVFGAVWLVWRRRGTRLSTRPAKPDFDDTRSPPTPKDRGRPTKFPQLRKDRWKKNPRRSTESKCGVDRTWGSPLEGLASPFFASWGESCG